MKKSTLNSERCALLLLSFSPKNTALLSVVKVWPVPQPSPDQYQHSPSPLLTNNRPLLENNSLLDLLTNTRPLWFIKALY